MLARVCGVALFLMEAALLGQPKLPASDTELWSEVDATARLASNWDLMFIATDRTSSGLANPVLAGLGPLVNFGVIEHITLTGGYLYVVLPNTGKGYSANVPLAAVTLSEKIGRLEISDRNRGERLIGIPGDPFRYRNKLALLLPLGSGRWHLFASDEVFYDYGAEEWNQNRLEAGTSHSLNKRLRIDLYYLERNVRGPRPGTSHGIGVTLGVRLR